MCSLNSPAFAICMWLSVQKRCVCTEALVAARSPRGRPASAISAISAVSRQERVKQMLHAPYKGNLMDLLKLCQESDRWVMGLVRNAAGHAWKAGSCNPSRASHVLVVNC